MIESDSTDTKPVRASEQLAWAALDAFAREQLSTVLGAQFDATAPMTVEQFPGGGVAMVDALASLHAVDTSAYGLAALGKPAGFVARQVRGWTDRWHGSQTSDLPEMDALAAWLDARLPLEPRRPTLVHGDFKLDNVMLDARDVGRIVAVFDWEMSAVGDPLVDLGILLCYWVHIATGTQRDAVTSVTNRAGWFTRAELLERYGARTGFDLSNITFYEVFAVFKLAVVLQQIFYRYRRGQTDDPRFAMLDERVKWLARIGATLVEKV